MPLAEVQRLLHLYRDRCGPRDGHPAFNVRHFYHIARRTPGVTVSYSFVKKALQAAGLVPKHRARGRHRRRRPPRPCFGEVSRLDTIPGVNQRTAEVLIAEIGVDMGVFPTAAHLASWAGLYPGNHESARKHKPGKTRKGNRWLRGALIQAALAAGTRSTKGAFAARYRRVMRHRGHQKAVVAVAHAMLVGASSRPGQGSA